MCGLVGGDNADHDVGCFHCVVRGITGGHACPLDPRAHGGGDLGIMVGQLDIVSAHAGRKAAGGQRFGDRKPGFAKSDECK